MIEAKQWLKSYSEGVPHNIELPQDINLVQEIETAFKRFASAPALECMGAQLSYKELDAKSLQFAGFLQNVLRLEKGDRIALQLPNILSYSVALIGALRAGLVVVNVNPLYTEREMQHQLKDSGAKAIVIFENFAHKLQNIWDQTPLQHAVTAQVGDLMPWPKGMLTNWAVRKVKKMVPAYNLPQSYNLPQALKAGAYRPLKKPHILSEDLAFLQYTGGTTGVSKGAMLSHRNVCANMLQVHHWGLDKILEPGKEVVITALPLYHIFALVVNGLCMLRQGAKSVLIPNPRDMEAFTKVLSKTPFTVFTGVNTLFAALCNREEFRLLDFSKLKISVGGGAAVQSQVQEHWKQITGQYIVEGYGLTEASPVVCVNPFDPAKNRLSTVGLPVPSTQVRVVNDKGEDVKGTEPGELWVKGPQVMQGYWERPEETAKVLQESWLRTGDVASVADDGYVKLVDRKKDMILVSGFNVYPNEVEDICMQHPAVAEIAAVGVPHPKTGESVKVFAVLKQGASLDLPDLQKFCRDKLVAYKTPRGLEIKSELPKSPIGKVLRRKLLETKNNDTKKAC